MRLWLGILGVVIAAQAPVLAETIVIKGDATITGRILTTKKDHVIVDLGYTVLSIPRSEIQSIQQVGVATNSASQKPDTPQAQPPAPGKDGRMFRLATSAAEDRSVRELVAELGEAVVQVRTPGGLGSGFILNEEGFLITNFHVIEGDTQISVEVYNQHNGAFERRGYKQIRIVAINKFQDLALLKIEDPKAPKFRAVALGDSDQLAVGERVFAIGSPLGLERTVTEGIVSTKTRQVQGDLYLQTTTAINPGNSGGPLFNLRGEVVGVTNMKLAFGEGLGFAIPVNAVRFFLDHREAYAYEHDNPNTPYHYLEPPSRLKQKRALDDHKENRNGRPD
jgi:serine protease Do